MDPSHSLGGPPGEPVPEVDPSDVKAVWELSESARKSHPGMCVGVDVDTFKRACSPGADIPALWYRTTLIAALPQMCPEIVIPSTKDGEPTGSVFRAAAQVPMEWLGSEEREGLPFDVEDFMRRASED